MQEAVRSLSGIHEITTFTCNHSFLETSRVGWPLMPVRTTILWRGKIFHSMAGFRGQCLNVLYQLVMRRQHWMLRKHSDFIRRGADAFKTCIKQPQFTPPARATFSTEWSLKKIHLYFLFCFPGGSPVATNHNLTLQEHITRAVNAKQGLLESNVTEQRSFRKTHIQFIGGISVGGEKMCRWFPLGLIIRYYVLASIMDLPSKQCSKF